MKQIIKIAAIVALVLVAFSSNAQDNKKQNESEVLLSVSIDCKNCVKKVEANIPFEKGIKDMKVSLEEKTVWIKYQNNKTNVDKIIKAINDLGYSAEIIKSDEKPKVL